MTLERRVEALEEFRQTHDTKTDEILEKLGKMEERLNLYMGTNGSFAMTLRDKRVRFAGSLSIPAALGTGGTTVGGIVFLVGRALGQW